VVPDEAVPGQVTLVTLVGAAVAIVNTTLFEVPPRVAAIMSQPVRVVLVVYAKEAVVVPVAIVAEAGTCNPTLLDLSDTTAGEVAGAAIPTVHVPDAPGRTEVGLQARDIRVGTTLPGTSERVTFAAVDP
jgi:hypothetical protein